MRICALGTTAHYCFIDARALPLAAERQLHARQRSEIYGAQSGMSENGLFEMGDDDRCQSGADVNQPGSSMLTCSAGRRRSRMRTTGATRITNNTAHLPEPRVSGRIIETACQALLSLGVVPGGRLH